MPQQKEHFTHALFSGTTFTVLQHAALWPECRLNTMACQAYNFCNSVYLEYDRASYCSSPDFDSCQRLEQWQSPVPEPMTGAQIMKEVNDVLFYSKFALAVMRQYAETCTFSRNTRQPYSASPFISLPDAGPVGYGREIGRYLLIILGGWTCVVIILLSFI